MPDLLESLRALVGEVGVLDAPTLAKRSAGAMRADALQALALVRPANTAEVSAVLRLCHERHLGVVTQGGLTGLVHGADAGPEQIILSLERMRSIEAIDAVQRTATVQAGVTVQALQEAVQAQDLAFPLDLGSRGSATLGGTAATNAGGNRVLRFGMTRDMVLGLEVVLADGSVVSSLNHLIKNNAGYDWFIGSEGTLGVITRLVLRLRERPRSHDVALVALPSFDAVAQLLKHMDRSLGGQLSAFEVMWPSFYQLVTTPPAQGRPPLAPGQAFYALVESQGASIEADAERFAAALQVAMDEGLVVDATVAQSGGERQALWALRDDVAQVMVGGVPMGFDISLPIGEMERYTRELAEALQREIGAHQLWIFGHLGDGNLHIVVQVGAEQATHLRPRIEALVYAPLAGFGGSVSAEHGIGLEKKAWLAISRSEPEIALMRRIKAALDPQHRLNPAKVLP